MFWPLAHEANTQHLSKLKSQLTISCTLLYLNMYAFEIVEDPSVSDKRNVQRRVDYRLFSNESKICIKNDQKLLLFDRIMTKPLG